MSSRFKFFLLAALAGGLCLPSLARAQNLSQQEVTRQTKQARDLANQGRHGEAAAIYEKILPAAERLHGKDTAKTAGILINLADSYRALAQFTKAEPLYLRTLRIRETQLGKDHTDTATTLNGLGLLYIHHGEYAKAEPLLLRSLAIRESKHGKDHLLVAQTCGHLGTVYRGTGQHAKAELYYLRALAIREARLGKDHAQVAGTLNQLSSLYVEKSQFAKAEPVQVRCLAIHEAKLGKDHPQTAEALFRLAILYRYMGQYAKAEPLYLRSLAIRETKLGKDHLDTAHSQNALGALYLATRQYAKAEPLLRRGLETRTAKLGTDNFQVALSLDHLAWLYEFTGQYAKAEPLFSRSLEIREAKLGKDHPRTAEALGSLARLYTAMGQHAKAEPVYQRAAEIYQARFGPDDFHAARALNGVAVNAATQKEWARAIGHFQKARRATANYLADMLPALSEHEQLSLLHANFDRPFHAALSMGYTRAPEAVPVSAEWLLNGKAIAHQSLAAQQLLARDATNPTAKQLVADLRTARARLAGFINRTPRPGQEKQHLQEMQALKTSEQELAQRLARAVGRPYRANPWVKLDEVRAKLGPKSAFVDIARFAVYDFVKNKWQPARYVAWITPPPGQGDVRRIDLGAAADIDQLIDRSRTALVESAKIINKVGESDALEMLHKPLKELSAKVLQPLLPALAKYEEWIVCPDGALWLTPWNALPLPDGKFAIEKHQIRHVVSGRDLVLELPKAKTQSAYIFADPDYDLNPGKVMLAARLQTQQAAVDLRSLGSAFGSLPRVQRLAGTALEAEAVQPRVQQWLKLKPKVFMQGQASEAMLRSIKNPRVLVLATHGYFLPAQRADSKDIGLEDDGERAAALFDRTGQPIENPLLRCGLLLAGCNQRAEAKPGEDDGILTGLEIVGMDLNGCELVVLSACETGLGDVRNGEGVAGLRQAFQLAGAKAVLASLWQVPDRDTAFLMNTFYGELATGRSQAEALRQAQLQRIAARRSQFGAAHPFFWAAFALTSRGAD